jgi:hypothetical protein
MRELGWVLVWIAAAAWPAACDSEVTEGPSSTTTASGGGTGGSAGSGATGGSGGSGAAAGTGGTAGQGGGGGVHVGDCSGASDCPGGSCQPVPNDPDGYWTCVYPPPSPTTQASSNPSSDECTDASDCETGCDCYLIAEMYPGFVYPHNECVCEECQSDADCADPSTDLCIPAGAWGMPKYQCFTVECKLHDDCSAKAGGLCIAYLDSCSAVDPRPFAGKFCHYDDDPCLTDSDCTPQFCYPDWQGEGFSCGYPPCPG